MTSGLTRGVFIVGAKRTPFGKFGGKLKDLTCTDLAVVAAKAALTQAGVKPEMVDSTVVGNVNSSSSSDAIMISRHVGLRSGVPETRPALTVNRLCGSGFQSIINGAQEIVLGLSNIVLTGGSENMSQIPHAVRGIRFGLKLTGKPTELEDLIMSTSVDSLCNLNMAGTAEKLAVKYNLSREEVDKMALRSQQRWKKAHDAGHFKEETAPVTIKVKGQDVVVDVDEHPRPQTTLEGLASLPAVFKKNGVVTAGSASGVCDGAGAVIVASEEAVKKHNLKPLARLVGFGIAGVDPSIMGIGPAPAIRMVLEKAGKKIEDIDLFDVNEAFAAQFLAVEKELNLDPSKSNVNGGAVALGHPLGASGSRITSTLIYELKRRNAKYAVGGACIGGGQGIALLLENVN
jgi:acetyl-CoA acyltransferase 2